VAFDLAADFSDSQNPNGAWSFWWVSTNNVFNLYTEPFAAYGLALQEWRGSFPSNDGSAPPDVICNPTDSPITVSDTTWLPHQVTFHPGQQGEQSVVRWTSSLAGTIELKAAFEGRSDFVTSGVEVYRNNSLLYSVPIVGTGDASRMTFSTNLVVLTGDWIDFRVNYGNGSWTSDTTQISVAITAAPERLLAISVTEDARIRLAWSKDFVGYQLESTQLLPASSWLPVTNLAVVEGDQIAVTLSITNAQEYFRLHKP